MCEVLGILIDYMGGSSHNVYTYEYIIMINTLSIFQFF